MSNSVSAAAEISFLFSSDLETKEALQALEDWLH